MGSVSFPLAGANTLYVVAALPQALGPNCQDCCPVQDPLLTNLASDAVLLLHDTVASRLPGD